MKFDKTAKNPASKKNPFTSTATPAKVVAKPVVESKPAPAKASAPVAKTPVAATPIVTKSPLVAAPVAVSKPAPGKIEAPIAKSPIIAAPVVVSTPAKIEAPVEKAKAAPAPVAETKPISKASRSATIEAKIDVGFGNTLYLRGEGKGLNWNQGIPLTNVDGSTWQWSGEADEKLKVKLLLNDAVWAKGEDLVVAPGEKVQIAPAF